MTRTELKEIICQVIEKVKEHEPPQEQAPAAACIFGDHPCDATTKYSVNEEG